MRARNGAAGSRENRGATAAGRLEARGVGSRLSPSAEYWYVNLFTIHVLLVLVAVII